MDGLKSLRAVIEESLRQPEGDRSFRDLSCTRYWPEVVGETVAAATRVQGLRDGVLLVAAKTSTWAFELTFFKDAYRRGLNERVGKPVVRDIRFRVGRVEESARPGPAPQPAPPPADPLPQEMRAEVERIAAPVTDPNLRARLQEVLVRETRRQEWRLKRGWKPCDRCRALHPGTGALCPLCRLSRR